MARGMLKRIWDWELTDTWALRRRWVPAWAVLTMVVYVVMEVVVLAPSTVVGLAAYMDLRARGWAEATSYDLTARIFPWLFPALVGANVLFRIYIGLEGYFFRERTGQAKGRFFRNLLLYNPAAVFTLGLHAACAAALGLLLWAFGYDFASGFEFLMTAGSALRRWLIAHLPTLIALPYKWMAAVVVLTLYSFVAYFEHWLTHKNRFLWHVVHAPHHLPDYLHPLGAPLAFSFDMFLLPVRVVIGAALTKLVYVEPMLLESALAAVIAYSFEIFNHSTAHYGWTARNKFMRWLGRLCGGHGAYHYLHHSSAERHQMVNLGAGLFMLWDRVFGTFEEPPTDAPEVGWTGNPEIVTNPLRVVFAGPAKIWYELRHNRGLGTKLRILFGSVHWNPPQTAEYLKVAKGEKVAA